MTTENTKVVNTLREMKYLLESGRVTEFTPIRELKPREVKVLDYVFKGTNITFTLLIHNHFVDTLTLSGLKKDYKFNNPKDIRNDKYTLTDLHFKTLVLVDHYRGVMFR